MKNKICFTRALNESHHRCAKIDCFTLNFRTFLSIPGNFYFGHKDLRLYLFTRFACFRSFLRKSQNFSELHFTISVHQMNFLQLYQTQFDFSVFGLPHVLHVFAVSMSHMI